MAHSTYLDGPGHLAGLLDDLVGGLVLTGRGIVAAVVLGLGCYFTSLTPEGELVPAMHTGGGDLYQIDLVSLVCSHFPLSIILFMQRKGTLIRVFS